MYVIKWIVLMVGNDVTFLCLTFYVIIIVEKGVWRCQKLRRSNLDDTIIESENIVKKNR